MEEQLKHLDDNSVDSIVTDPPYHLLTAGGGGNDAYGRVASKGFMGKEWDGGDIAFRQETWEECLRVLKPGGHIIAFSGSRTYHRMAVAIEDAGFEIRDQILWVYGSGFPKSHNIGKAYDKKHGIEREDLGANPNNRPNPNNVDTATHDYGFVSKTANVTKGNGPFEGWGTGLKPAHEPMVLARKPISEKTVVDNCEKWGVGAINIDASRVPSDDSFEHVALNKNPTQHGFVKLSQMAPGGNAEALDKLKDMGRFPANFIHDGVFDDAFWGKYFYVPKVNKKDRNEGLDGVLPSFADCGESQPTNVRDRLREITTGEVEATGLANTHPTVKPTELMHYLIRMVTPAGGIVLDPFMGSGSTGKAAIRHGFDFIGIEMEEESYEVAKARIEFES